MNTKFTPRAITLLVVSFSIFALFLSACGTGNQPAPTASSADLRSTANAMDATCPAYNEKGWPLTEVTPSGTCIYTSLETATAPISVAPAPTAPAAPSGTCEDGKIVGNQYANLNRVPVGTAEGIVVAELSWTGSGFAGYDRAIVIVPQLSDTRYAIHVRNPRTVHEVQYCGTIEAVENWAPTHVDAMVITAQADDGSRPDAQEIGVYRLALDGTLTEIRPGPKGPGIEAIKQRLVVSVNK